MKIQTNVKAHEAMRGCQTCEDLKNNLARFAMTYWNTVQVNRTVASAHPDKAGAEEIVADRGRLWTKPNVLSTQVTPRVDKYVD